jgi:hypothetical protein
MLRCGNDWRIADYLWQFNDNLNPNDAERSAKSMKFMD